MKKKLWMLGMAVAALTSCTQSEVVDIPEAYKIEFSTFVDKTTRAATDTYNDITVDNISKMWVYGDVYAYDANNTFTAPQANIFKNLEVTRSTGTEANSTWTYNENQVAYWQLNKTYRFAAYSDGNASLTDETGVKYVSNAQNDYIKFPNYQAKGKDLVAALHGDKHTNNGILKDPVTFTMNHMLTKIVFEFYLDKELTDSKVYLSDFAINNAYNKGDCTFTYSSDNQTLNLPVWTYDDETIVTSNAYSDANGASYELSTGKQYVVFYVIPNTNFGENNIPNLTFNYKSYGKDVTPGDNNYIHNESYKLSLDTKSVTTYSRWLPGYSYKYIIQYSQSTTDETPITFTVGGVDAWRPGFGSNTQFVPDKQK